MIKTIVNNTEKEIEQIKNSNEQDIDYVYSRIGDTEVEGTPPISIKSIGGELADYRIYGNTVGGESVGDLVESGEHAGEYKVPVTVEGKNLAKNNHTDSSALFTVEEVNNFIHVSGTNNSGSTKAVVISAGNSFPVGKYDIVNNSNTAITYDYKNENNVLVSANVDANSIKTINFPAVFTRKLNVFKSVSNGNSIDTYFQVMIVKHGDDTDTYEPYHAPVTTSIYLPEQIRKVGDEAEYIDYGEQKLHRIGTDDINVTLPALSTIKGTNTLSVGTSIQPSNIYIKDNFDYKKVFTATRTIEGESPLNYKNIEDNDSTLSNYRIYGNTVGGESVGDLVESGEHAGEYSVPVTVTNGTNTETTNIYLPEQIKMVGDVAEYIDYAEQKLHRVRKNLLKNTMTRQTISGVTFTGNSDGSITCNGTASGNILVNIIPSTFSLPEGAYILNGAPPGEGQNYNFKLDVRVSTNKYYPDTGNGIRFNILQGEPITMCRIVIYSGYTCDNLTFYPMLRKADIEDDTYEPYIKNTDLDVTLPALPTIKGTNVLSVGTAVQPSGVEIKGKIKQ